MATSQLVLHCGAREVTRDELALVPCPPPEGRWRPVSHDTVLCHALKALTDGGYEVEKMQLGVSRDDRRFFEALTLRTGLVTGVSLAVGLRSSTDKSLALGFAYGSRCFTCDNLAFRSEYVVNKKHTTFAVDRYFEAICRCVSDLASFRDMETVRIQRMKHRMVSDHFAEALLLRAYQDEGILSPRTLPVALKEWREPSFPDFEEEKNAWRLYNAITYAVGQRARTNPQAHAACTIRLGALLQEEAAASTLPLPAA